MPTVTTLPTLSSCADFIFQGAPDLKGFAKTSSKIGKAKRAKPGILTCSPLFCAKRQNRMGQPGLVRQGRWPLFRFEAPLVPGRGSQQPIQAANEIGAIIGIPGADCLVEIGEASRRERVCQSGGI